MKRFKVTIERTVYQQAEIEVDAKSREEAVNEAMYETKHYRDGYGRSDWTYVDSERNVAEVKDISAEANAKKMPWDEEYETTTE